MEPEEGGERRGLLAWLVSQHGVHGRGIDDLAGVENIFRVPALFDLAHEQVILLADHLRDELAAKPAVAVFAAEGAAVFFDEGGDFSGNGAEEVVAFFGFQVDDRPQVDLAAAGMGVVDGVKSIFFEDLVEVADISRQVLHVNSGIFDHRDGLVVAGEVAEEAEAGFAEVPDLSRIVPEEEREMDSRGRRRASRPQGGAPVRGSRRGYPF